MKFGIIDVLQVNVYRLRNIFQSTSHFLDGGHEVISRRIVLRPGKCNATSVDSIMGLSSHGAVKSWGCQVMGLRRRGVPTAWWGRRRGSPTAARPEPLLNFNMTE